LTQEQIDQEARPVEAAEEQEQVPVPGAGEGSWYIMHCYSTMEDRVKKNLELRIASMDVRDKVFEVVVPTEEVVEIKEGRRTPKRERMYPGYVLVRMLMDDQSWYVVRNTPGVTGFISAEDDLQHRSKPIPLTDQEVDSIFRRMVTAEPRAKIGFTIGQNVKIVDGPFKEFIGTVDEIYADKGKLRVLIAMLGRETPVEMDVLQVEQIS
jgi:transcriptional antiterminator NusG